MTPLSRANFCTLTEMNDKRLKNVAARDELPLYGPPGARIKGVYFPIEVLMTVLLEGLTDGGGLNRSRVKRHLEDYSDVILSAIMKLEIETNRENPIWLCIIQDDTQEWWPEIGQWNELLENLSFDRNRDIRERVTRIVSINVTEAFELVERRAKKAGIDIYHWTFH